MASPSTLWVAALLAAAMSGCLDVDGQEPLRPGAAAFELFVTSVEPVLEARCANPSCHGDARRPLELYAPERHRAREQDLYEKSALRPEELRANHLRTCAFVDDLQGRSSLLEKPIGVDSGGMGHEGGAVFESRDDPEYAALVAWVLALKDEARSRDDARTDTEALDATD